MIRFQTQPLVRDSGFTILEVLVSLMIAGLLMAGLGLVMAQTLQNNSILQEVQGPSRKIAALRRLLHRDLRGIQTPVTPLPEGFLFKTSHNILMDGPLPVLVEWSFQGGQLTRTESAEDLDYRTKIVLLRSIESWKMEFLDMQQQRWIVHRGAPLAGGPPQVGAVNFELHLGNDIVVNILERAPYAWTKNAE